jgi:aminopeptidase N
VDGHRRRIRRGRGEGLGPPGAPPQGVPFVGDVYVRGALTLHSLRLEVGEGRSFDILRTFHERFRHGNAGAQDFLDVAEELAGVGADWFEPWLYDDEAPPLPARSPSQSMGSAEVGQTAWPDRW